MNPLISVIIPVFNVVRFCPKCIHSILSQTFQDFELLLIDDGSTDGSENFVIVWRVKMKEYRSFILRILDHLMLEMSA